MNTEKIKTLEQVHNAIDIVEEEREKPDLTPDQTRDLESALLKLRNLERTIIRIKTNELIDSLIADSDELKELTARIKESAQKLEKVAEALETAVNVVKAFIKLVKAAVSGGFLD
jgi:hypothetical protein